MTIITTPISTAIGVAVAGYTSSDFLTPDAARNCQALLDRYGGVVYREAHVTDADLVAFSRALGGRRGRTGAHPDHPETRHGSTRRCGGAAMAASLC